MTYKNHEVKLVERQEISQTRKDHWVFTGNWPTGNAAGQNVTGNVETCDLYAPCGPSAPFQAQVIQCAVSGVSPSTI
jgi:hypothetical protein